MINLKQLLITEGFEKVSDLLSNPENNEKHLYQLLDAFKENGGVILGQGRYATVLFYPSWKHVIKIFSDDVPYLKYVRFCLKNPRKSFPIFYDKPRSIIPNYKRHKSRVYLYVVKTEKLNPINMREYDNLWYYISYDKGYAQAAMADGADVGTWEFIYNKLIKLEQDIPSIIQFKNDYRFLMNNARSFGDIDIHKNNIMKRDNGEFVLSDPFFEGGNAISNT